MKIAIDGRWLSRSPHGIARYCAQLIQHLPLRSSDQLVVFYNRSDYMPPSANPDQMAEILWWDLNLPLFSATEFWRMPQILRFLQPDLLHIPAYWKPYPSPCPWLMTIHDLIHLRPPVKASYALYYRLLRQQLLSAAGILTVSKTSAERIQEWSGRPAKSIYQGVETHFRPLLLSTEWFAARGIRLPFLLTVSNAKAHKNTVLIKQLLAQSSTEWQWVSLGLPQSTDPRHLALQAISEFDLAGLYTAATALLMPSLEEGFGLPVMESLACQTPVLAADIPVFREILGPDYPLLSPALSDPAIRAWQTAIDTLVLEVNLNTAIKPLQRPDSYRQRLLDLAKPPQSSWQQLGAETLETYRECV